MYNESYFTETKVWMVRHQMMENYKH